MTLADSRLPTEDLVLVDRGRDHTVRWKPGERFHHVFEETVDRLHAEGRDGHLAVDLPGERISYRDLDERANRLARRLIRLGVRPGDRVGLLFDRSAHAYVAMLAVSKAHAAYVPLDPGFPADRMAFICADAGVGRVLTREHLAPRLADLGIVVTAVDGQSTDPPESPDRLDAGEVGAPEGDLAYVIYTSGTTGRPKGVAIEHASICNFIRVAAAHYGITDADRVYQGMTIAFDFSVEEIWVPLTAGATLVPGPAAGALLGPDLADFITERRITALCCVPTLLATLEEDLPDLRFLLVSGEACPAPLVRRWSAPGRRFLNVYGPTEATVTATWSTLEADRPVTIGVPLPTYSVLVLDPASGEPLPRGATGEIAIAGIGLSTGYVGRPELTERAFIPDPLGLPDNPSRRLYRTGDLGRVDADGQLEYLGRIDTQVKIRGYRIELAEIESVLLEEPGVAQVAVTTHEPEPGVVELAAFYTATATGAGGSGLDEALEAWETALLDRLRTRVPEYMVPAYLERLDRMPVLPSDKVDRSALPAPTARRLPARRGPSVAPAGPAETELAGALAAVLAVPDVSADADLFAELGADSLHIARFCARVRTQPGLERIATQDVYLNPTVQRLAAALAAGPAESARPVGEPAVDPRAPHVASRVAYLACGLAQGLVLVGFLLFAGLIGTLGYRGFADGDWLAGYLRAMTLLLGSTVLFTVLPITLKWVLIGRYRPEPIPVWSAAYLRFWFVRVLLSSSPARLFVGTSAYNLYLRVLGVRVGRHALILTGQPPVCADLVRIGAGAVIRAGAKIDGYRVERGWILPGPVEVGTDALIEENSLLDIDTVVGDRGQLAHASALLQGGRIPPGERYHGSPAVPSGSDPETFGEGVVPGWRRGAYAVAQGLAGLLFSTHVLVLVISAAVWLDISHPLRAAGFGLGLLALSILTRTVVPRVLGRALRPDRPYPLFGVRWAIFRLVVVSSNSRFFNELFGDSSAITGYLRAIGIRFVAHVQTGSNFGMNQRQHVPTLCQVGGGSLVSDGLLMPNADFTAQSFRVRRIEIGAQVFMGNVVLFPPNAGVGDNCLLATKVMVPNDGVRRTGVGLLGSPAFEIPRTVARDAQFDRRTDTEGFRRKLAAKNRHNFGTAVLFLLNQYTALFITVSLIVAFGRRGPVWLALALLLGMLAGAALLIAVDHLTRGFRRLGPMQCSLYDRRFWRHERYWKVNDVRLAQAFNGTPLKPLLWRALGVRVGRQLFDDGCHMPERSLVTIGDHATLGNRTMLHGHSLEDGGFKSDRLLLGSGVTVGPGAIVHYGVDIGDGVVIAPDSFVMKGERAEPGTVWRGNPARLVLPDVRQIGPGTPASHGRPPALEADEALAV